MSIDNLIFRASSVPNLMGAKGLGVTGQKEAVKAYLNQFTDRYKDIKSKYLEKGIAMENGAIQLVNELRGTDYQKNDVRMFNDFLTGECDLICGDTISDIKCSWDIFTFYESMGSEGKDYEYQLRAYMELWNRPKAEVIYCLMDMPDTMLLNELERAGRPYDGDLPDLIAIRIIKNSIFDLDNFHRFLEFAPIDRKAVEKEINKFIHIPKADRVYSFDFERNQAKTELMYQRINDARQFLKTHLNK